MKTLRYIPELNKTTGSINATLLLLQLEYWFTKTGGKSFFKFLAPCEHEAYRPLDSWTEELGFSKAEFRHAFNQIGKVYKSKTAYQNSPDPFEGKFYLSYFDRIRKITYYVRNTQAINTLLTSHTFKDPLSTDADCEDGLSLDNTSILPSLNYTKDLAASKESDSPTPYMEIVHHFHARCPHLEQVKALSAKRKKSLDILWDYANHNLASIIAVFKAVSQNDFLSGRLPAKSWKACFDWIIKLPHFYKIKKGHYAPYVTNTVPSTPSPVVSTPQKKSLFNSMYSHNWDFDKLQELEDDYITRKLATSSIHRVSLGSSTL